MPSLNDLLSIWPWVAFLLFVGAMLIIDLTVLHKDAHEVSRKEALIWTGVVISAALIFNAGVFIFRGSDDGLAWTTGYLIEQSLSVDNVFVFMLLFGAFTVPPAYQHRVLFWGILGALIMRGILIAFAGFLINQLHFVIYLFGAFLIFTGIRFLTEKETHVPNIEDNKLVKLARRFFPVTETYEGQSLFVRRAGVLMMTPLMIVLILIESTDLVFAVDSIPAIYAVTRDPFIVFTSNIFAILGLRSLYFVMSGYLAGMRYLKPGLAAVLSFVGAKMILSDIIHFHPLISLGVIISILTIASLASIRYAKRNPTAVTKELEMAMHQTHLHTPPAG
ncbi:MAG TPA: TerC family protein, partial [Thermomicrobiales bacterium]|nr:TerC family protein [Thermomicrobiales bacterium]